MAVSTVSVIESIIVMRLCSMQDKKVPSVLHSIAFRVIGRALCVSLSSDRHRREKRGGRKAEVKPEATSDVQESLLGDTELSNVGKNSSELVEKINEVLVELRKVRL